MGTFELLIHAPSRPMCSHSHSLFFFCSPAHTDRDHPFDSQGEQLQQFLHSKQCRDHLTAASAMDSVMGAEHSPANLIMVGGDDDTFNP